MNTKRDERISRLLEDASTPETSENGDPFEDDEGEYDSDVDYRPPNSSESSEDLPSYTVTAVLSFHLNR